MTAEIVKFRPSGKPTDDEINSAWTAYLVARERAEKSKDINDAIASGNAFARFHWLFVGHDK